MLTDVDIMIRVQAGETSLFAELVHRYQAKLLRFATSKLGNSTAAEDLVQEAFLAAYHARDSYSSNFAFSTWIWTITLNLTRKATTKRQNERERFARYQIQNRPQNISETGLETLLKSEQSQQLDRWLEQIPEAQSDAIRLRFFGRLPFAEIALAMDCSESGAKRRVKSGLIKLAELSNSDD